MIAVKVSVNGKVACAAGTEDLCVLNAVVGAVGNLGKLTKKVRDEPPHLSLRVGGLTRRENDPDEHLNWIEPLDLVTGDLVTIEVLEAESADPPVEARPFDEERSEKKRKEEWEYAKTIYFKFNDKFEGEVDS